MAGRSHGSEKGEGRGSEARAAGGARAPSEGGPEEPRAADPPAGEPRFEEILERLRLVVEKLESGALSLEQSLLVFEEGIRLSRLGASRLEGAEQTIERLLAEEGPGGRAVPFEEPGGPGRGGAQA